MTDRDAECLALAIGHLSGRPQRTRGSNKGKNPVCTFPFLCARGDRVFHSLAACHCAIAGQEAREGSGQTPPTREKKKKEKIRNGSEQTGGVRAGAHAARGDVTHRGIHRTGQGHGGSVDGLSALWRQVGRGDGHQTGRHPYGPRSESGRTSGRRPKGRRRPRATPRAGLYRMRRARRAHGRDPVRLRSGRRTAPSPLLRSPAPPLRSRLELTGRKKAQRDIQRGEYDGDRDDQDPDPCFPEGGGRSDDETYDEIYDDHDSRTDTILRRATHAAVELGCLDALRYLTTRPILGRSTSSLIDEDLVVDAARAGQVAIVAYAHDRMFRADDGVPCSCTDRVGRAAWEAPTIDVLAWMRNYGCLGCEAPTPQDVGCAISQGRTDMLRHILSDATFDLDADLLEPDIAAAAYKGHVDTLRLVIDNNMCPRIDPIVIGAARGGNIDILCWALLPGDDGARPVRWRMPSASVMRTAVIVAASRGHGDAVAWIADRYRDVVDVVLLCAAIDSASLSVVRAVDARLPATFDWQRVVARVIAAGSVDVLGFVVKEKRVALDPLAIADAGDMTDAMAEYVLRVCAPDDIQKGFDAALVDDGFWCSPRVRHISERMPGLCASLMWGGDPAARCPCARCAPPRCATDIGQRADP